MNEWHPEQGERVYFAHAITKNKFVSCFFIRWWGGCLIVFFNGKLHRCHVRHSGMKQVIKITGDL